MKSFLWRLRSNYGWFLLALAVFTGLYLLLAYSEFWYSANTNSFEFKHVDPFIVSVCVSFGFFFVYSKRYTYDEEYVYGHSRKRAYCMTQCVAAVYAFIFACYALVVALIVRRSILSASDLLVPADVYRISTNDIIYNIISLFIADMFAFELASIFRKFRSWKFWLSLIICIGVCVGVYYILVNISEQKWFNYWVGMFVIFIPLLIVSAACDYFMTRGRQYR